MKPSKKEILLVSLFIFLVLSSFSLEAMVETKDGVSLKFKSISKCKIERHFVKKMLSLRMEETIHRYSFENAEIEYKSDLEDSISYTAKLSGIKKFVFSGERQEDWFHTEIETRKGQTKEVWLKNFYLDGVILDPLTHEKQQFSIRDLGFIKELTMIKESENKPPMISKIQTESQQETTVFSWTANDNDGVVIEYQYKMDNGDWKMTYDTEYKWTVSDDDEHLLRVRAKDDNGNFSKILTWSFKTGKEVAFWRINNPKIPLYYSKDKALFWDYYNGGYEIFKQFEETPLKEFPKQQETIIGSLIDANNEHILMMTNYDDEKIPDGFVAYNFDLEELTQKERFNHPDFPPEKVKSDEYPNMFLMDTEMDHLRPGFILKLDDGRYIMVSEWAFFTNANKLELCVSISEDSSGSQWGEWKRLGRFDVPEDIMNFAYQHIGLRSAAVEDGFLYVSVCPAWNPSISFVYRYNLTTEEGKWIPLHSIKNAHFIRYEDSVALVHLKNNNLYLSELDKESGGLIKDWQILEKDVDALILRSERLSFSEADRFPVMMVKQDKASKLIYWSNGEWKKSVIEEISNKNYKDYSDSSLEMMTNPEGIVFVTFTGLMTDIYAVTLEW